jgi:hypothetical protein
MIHGFLRDWRTRCSASSAYFESGSLARDLVPGWCEFRTVVRSGLLLATRCVVEDSFADQASELRLAGDRGAAAEQQPVVGVENVKLQPHANLQVGDLDAAFHLTCPFTADGQDAPVDASS